MTDSQLRSLSPDQARQFKVEGFKGRPDRFTAHYLRDELTLGIAPFHVEIYKDLEDWSLKRLAIIAPTGFGKSSVVVFAYPLYAACLKSCRYIVLLSNTATFAERKLRDIKTAILSNEKIQSDFLIEPGSVWKENEIILNTGFRILALGAGSQITGERPDMILADDLQTEKQSKSEIERASLEYWWDASVMQRPTPDGRIAIVGSISNKLAFMNRFEEDIHKKVWTVKKYATHNCQSIWKAMWSDEDLRRKKQESAGLPGIYEALYEADASKIGKYAFKKEWLRYYQKIPEGCRFFTAVDPGAGENEGDCYTAIITGCIDVNSGLIYIADVIKRRFNVQTLELFGAMFLVYDIYRPIRFGIESVVFQKYLKVFFEKECRERGKTPNVVELKRDTKVSKDFRIRSLAHFFEEGKILIRPDMYALIAEYEAYPECASVDVLDALSMLVNDLMVPGKISANKGVAPRPQPGVGFQQPEGHSIF